MADDLDDEWWLNESESGVIAEEQEDSGTREEDQKPSGAGRKSKETQNKKRKLSASESSADLKKKSKRKKKSDELGEKGDPGPEPHDLMKAIDEHYDGKVSVVEKDELALEESAHFLACNSTKADPEKYMSLAIPKWARAVKQADKTPGAPLLLVVCPAALRAAQLNRLLEQFKGNRCKVGKLFAKHMKLTEQLKFLKKKAIHIGIGTPNRIDSLIENDGLSLKRLKHVILDWSWRDVKLRKMVDIPEVRKDMFALLKKHLIPTAQKGTIKFGLL